MIKERFQRFFQQGTVFNKTGLKFEGEGLAAVRPIYRLQEQRRPGFLKTWTSVPIF
jgi:hypothetical protein